MTIQQHIDSIKHIFSSGIESDDFRISDRFVFHQMKMVRAMLLQREADKLHFLPDENYQTINCIKLILTNAHDCNCVPEELGCKVRRSESKLPGVLARQKTGYIMTVSTPGGTIIPFRHLSSINNVKYRVTYNKKPFWYIHNQYLYIVNFNQLPAVIVTAIFDEPDELSNILLCDDTGTQSETACFDPKSDSFPIDTALASAMEDEVIKRISLMLKTPEDASNDSNDSIIPDAR